MPLATLENIHGQVWKESPDSSTCLKWNTPKGMGSCPSYYFIVGDAQIKVFDHSRDG